MPYFPDKHILFIHIPKTGGPTIEHCLLKQNINESVNLFTNKKIKLYSGYGNNLLPEPQLRKVSLQHQTYNTIYKYRDLLKIPFDSSLNIITIVRNPYYRIMSDLFWNKLVNAKTTPAEVYNIIQDYVKKNIDNHNIPQYLFVTDENGKLVENITILKTESLDADMEKHGYAKNRIRLLKNKLEKQYDDYLNDDSIEFINTFYKNDFIMFHYPMKKTKQSRKVDNTKLDFVTIIFDNHTEIDLLKLQAYSFSLVDANLVNNIYIIHQSNSEWTNVNETLSCYPANLRDKVRIIYYKDLNIPVKYLNNGWKCQQLCKLIVAKFTECQYYCVLDAKNHFLKKMTQNDFFSKDKYYIYTSPGATYYNDCFIDCLKCFGIEDAYNGNINNVSMSTPFIFDSYLVFDLIQYIEEQNVAFDVFFMQNNAITEFYLYSAFVLFKNVDNVAYREIIHTSIHRDPNESWSVRFIDTKLYLKPQFKVFGLHRDAINLMSSEYKSKVLKMYECFYDTGTLEFVKQNILSN
jgi:hypothetical protein